MISHDCIGTVKFPDETFPIKSFKYDEEEYKIVWLNQQTGEVWNKGKNFSNLIFIQIKYVHIIEIMKQTMKKKNQSILKT